MDVQTSKDVLKMADKDRNEKRIVKAGRPKENFFQKVAAFFVKIGKRLKSFFINLKAELKRVVWPDKKHLIQNTATVLAICLIAALVLFFVDSLLGGILNAVGFYSPSAPTAATTAATTAAATTSTETSAPSTGETTAATTAGTTAGG